MTTKNQTKLWQEHFSKGDYDERYPSEQVVRFLMRYKKRGELGSKVLDLGCGVGRHLLMALENGFSGYGMDIASSALKKTQKYIAAKGYHANLKKGSLTKLPYRNDFFDIVISYSVFDHVKFAGATRGIKEVKRVLKPGGLIYFKLETNNNPEMRKGRIIGKNTRILNSDCEKGITQHYFSLSEVRLLFKDFTILTLEKEEITDLLKAQLNISRWHIIAKKMKKDFKKIKKDTILITGGVGLIGSNLIHTLQDKYKIICLDHNDKPNQFKRLFNGNVKYIKGDITDEVLVDKVMSTCHIVIHLAGGGGNTACVNYPVWAVRTHILGTDLLLKKAIKYKIQKFIFASSISVYTTYHKRTLPFKENIKLEPDDFYGMLKKAAEALIRKSGVNYCIFRFTNVYGISETVSIQSGGAINNFIKSAFEGKTIQIYGTGKQKIDYINVKDVVNVILLVLESNNDCIYNVGSGELVTIKEIAEVVRDVFKDRFNQKIKIRKTTVSNNSIWPDRLMSINKIEKDLKWSHKMPLRTGIRDMIIENLNNNIK